MELVVLMGLQGAGKTTFFLQRFAGTHAHVSKDRLRSHHRPGRRQAELIDEALAAGRSVVVDNTNATVADRAALVAQARRHGARVVGFFLDCPLAECLARNAAREGRARIPTVGVLATARRFVPPTLAEGFDELHVLRPMAGSFEERPPA